MRTFQEIRKAKGISATHIAKAMGISRTALYNKENKKSLFSIAEGMMYCNLLGIKPEDVYEMQLH